MWCALAAASTDARLAVAVSDPHQLYGPVDNVKRFPLATVFKIAVNQINQILGVSLFQFKS